MGNVLRDEKDSSFSSNEWKREIVFCRLTKDDADSSEFIAFHSSRWVDKNRGNKHTLSSHTSLSLSCPSGKSLCCLPLFSCIIFTVFTLVSLKKELLSFFLSLRVLFSLCQMYQVESCVWEETFSLTNSNGFSRFLSWVTEKSASQGKIHKTCLTNNTNHMQRDTSQERMHFLLIDVHVLEVFDFRQDTGNTPLDTIAVLIERTSDANTSNWR